MKFFLNSILINFMAKKIFFFSWKISKFHFDDFDQFHFDHFDEIFFYFRNLTTVNTNGMKPP